MGSVTVRNLCKRFNEVVALDQVNIEIKEGEFFALLGPSGCGKTTTMRCIAGFEQPTEGDILIGERKVNDLPANKRNCGMVFQSYALFPHMTVFENVAYGLKVRELHQGGFLTKVKTLAGMLSSRLPFTSKHTEQKVRDALDYVELNKYADRLPSELSGGQQQRVALARALVMEPSVLLMDEPLSNLDKKLRNSMRTQIRRIQQDVGITTIFVTHDQEEAMSMADRVAVMSEGKVMQIATPTELYSFPKTAFIADFVGSSNIFTGDVLDRWEKGTIVRFQDFVLRSVFEAKKGSVEAVIRPESIEIVPQDQSVAEENVLEGEIVLSTYLGSVIRYDVRVGNSVWMVDKTYESGNHVLAPGEKVKLVIDAERVLLL